MDGKTISIVVDVNLLFNSYVYHVSVSVCIVYHVCISHVCNHMCVCHTCHVYIVCVYIVCVCDYTHQVAP